MRQTNTRKALCVIFSITLAVGLCPAPARGTIETKPAADALDTAEVPDATPAPDPTSAPDAAQASDSAQATEASEATGTDEAQASSSDEKSTASADAASDLDVPTALGALASTSSDTSLDPLESMTPQGVVGPTPDMAPQDELGPALDFEPQTDDIVDGGQATISRTNAAWSSSAGGTKYQLTLADQGLYMIHLYGAQGGRNEEPGKGGTTEGVATISANTVAYAVTGGEGGNIDGVGPGAPGGANGGGAGGNGNKYNGYMCNGGRGGGGATHLATTSGTLAEVLASGDDGAVMVAGGGGGAGGATTGSGGDGGGASGLNGSLNRTGSGQEVARGGTQSSGFQRGQGGRGGDGVNERGVGAEGRGGGGGGYWGGEGGQRGKYQGHNASGAGGSGFLNASYFPDAEKLADGSSIVSGDKTLATTRQGGGNGAGAASVSYLASIVTLDSHAPQEGTAVLYSAPQEDRYYTAYSMDGLEDEATKIELPQMDGWKFMGYYTGDDGEGTRYITADGTIEPGLYDLGSTTLHALWEPVVSFDASGVETTSFPAATSVQTGTPVTEPDKPTALNTTFKGWSTDKNTFQPYDFSRPVTEPITLYAFWTPHVEFVMHGHGNQVAPQFLQSGQAATQPTAPSETGYTFGGWFTDPAFAAGTEYDFSKPVTGDVVLHAKWSANEYTIEFVDDGRVAGTEDFVYNAEEKPLLTAEELGLEREGWEFAGWRATDALRVDHADGEQVRNLSTETGTLEFNAVWERDVTFHQASAADLLNALSPASEASASQATAVQQLTDGASYSSVTAPLLESVGTWTPVGWSADTAATTMSDVTPGAAFTPMTTEFYGLYRRTIHLAFDGSGAESGEVEDLTEAQHMNASGELTSATFTLPANAFEYAGHSFRAWDLGAPGDVVTLKPAAAESPDVTVHALWDVLPAAAGGGQSEDAPGARRGATPKTGDPTLPYAGGTAAVALLAMGIGAWRRRRSRR